jgi:hypothetical protein
VSKINPLQTGRFYKVKNPKKSFICALCSAPRQMKYSKNLEGKNFLQIIVLSTFLSWAFFPLMGVKSLSLLFPVWMFVEMVNKMLYRKDIPCPYCGFDATWYRRDVNVANTKVKTFWNDNFPDLVNKETLKVSNSDTLLDNDQIPPVNSKINHAAPSHKEAI